MAADRLGVDSDARREPEPAPVDPAERDSPGATGDELLRGADGITRQTERTREHVGAAAGDETDGRLGVDPVQDLVVAAVSGEDVHRLGAAGLTGELGRVTAMLGAPDLDIPERAGHLLDALLGDAARERVDDEEPHPAQDATESRG